MNNYLIVVAGGRGLRMGGSLPKQFAEVKGVPVLMRTLLALHSAAPEAKIILALPRDHQDFWQQLCLQHRFSLAHQVADGGETRFHSVQNALRLIPDGEEAVVAVHDGVRPFVSAAVVQNVLRTASERGAAIPVTPVVETLREIHGEESLTRERSNFRLVQTPQAFRCSLLKAAYAQPFSERFTDDASVVEALGHRISLVEGNRDNIKLTTPSDLQFAEFLCQASN